MPLSDAFLGRMPRIDPEDVPILHNKQYGSSPGEWVRDTRLMEAYLSQRGFTAEQIASKTMYDWSYLKTKFYDKGTIPPSHHIGLPLKNDDAGWKSLLDSYGITPENHARVKGAWYTFAEESHLSPSQIKDTFASGRQAKIVDGFFQEYHRTLRGTTEYADVHAELENMRGVLDTKVDNSKLLKALV